MTGKETGLRQTQLSIASDGRTELAAGAATPLVVKSHHKLSMLERLPDEILHLIFEFWPNLNLPASSPILGKSLSDRSLLLRVCKAVWVATLICDIHGTAIDLTQVVEFKNAVFGRSWFDVQFALELQAQLIKDHIIEEKLRVEQLSESNTDPNVIFMSFDLIHFWKEAYSDIFAVVGPFIPVRLIRGSWTMEDMALFELLHINMSLDIDHSQEEVRTALKRGVSIAVSEANWFMLYFLLRPSHWSPNNGEGRSLCNSLPDRWRHVVYGDCRTCVFDRDVYREKCKAVEVTPALLRRAVFDHGCHRAIVTLLLVHTLICPSGDFNYEDPFLLLWCTSRQGAKDGAWLQMMMRATACFRAEIHDISNASRSGGYRAFQDRFHAVLQRFNNAQTDYANSAEGGGKSPHSIAWQWHEHGKNAEQDEPEPALPIPSTLPQPYIQPPTSSSTGEDRLAWTQSIHAAQQEFTRHRHYTLFAHLPHNQREIVRLELERRECREPSWPVPPLTQEQMRRFIGYRLYGLVRHMGLCSTHGGAVAN